MSEFPDVEGAVRTYLRNHTEVSAAVGTRVFFEIPLEPTFPLVVVTRVGGFDDTSDAPVDQCLVEAMCIGGLHNDSAANPKKAEANAVRLAVRQALYELNSSHADVAVSGDDPHTVRLLGAVVQSDPYLPDPDNRRPRYPVTAQLTAARVAA